ncbi:hypothetical protein [Turicimonas muris]|uniref:hypothetical protein n=1 Tax=Turicimonas muris TaxID=1796652 RepID=UPI0024952DEA|nr:hypothetical protein [Turicimonas muris]
MNNCIQLTKKLKPQFVTRLRALLTEMYKDVPASESEPQIYQIVYSAVKNLEWAANGYCVLHACSPIYVSTTKGFVKGLRMNLSVLGKSFDLCALPDDFKEV